jgi:hypothetical protein
MTNYQFYKARKTCVGSLGGERKKNLLFVYSSVLLQIGLWVWLESMDRISSHSNEKHINDKRKYCRILSSIFVAATSCPF